MAVALKPFVAWRAAKQMHEMLKRQWICSAVNAGLFLVGAGLLISGIVVLVKVFPDIVTKTVNKNKVFGLNDDGTLNDFTKTWAYPSYISTMQYWAFDYKNTIGILNRALYPDVDEKGPYAYDETILNSQIKFVDNGEKMQFAQATQYVFNPAKSCPTCDPKKDTVTIPDISFFVCSSCFELFEFYLFSFECSKLGMAQIDAFVEKILGNQQLEGVCQLLLKDKCPKLAEIFEREIGSFMDLFKTGPFVTVTVDQLIFSGYVSPLVSQLADRLIKISNKLIGTDIPLVNGTAFTVALNTENGTTDTLYTVLTGKTDYSRAGYTISFTSLHNESLSSNGDKLPSQWYAFSINIIIFTIILKHDIHGDIFKSFIKQNESLPLYISDVCRSATLKYEKKVTVQGITGYRYILPAEEFDYSISDNCGFCNPNTLSKYGAYDLPVNSTCLPSGLLDISGCQNSPVIISKPHFYQASNIVRSFVPRFKPTYDNDETTLDIEPTTGTVLAANKRLQINMLLNQFSTIGEYSVLRPGAYPLIWLNESFIMDSGTRDDLNSSLFKPKNIVKIICWCAIGVGITASSDLVEETYCRIAVDIISNI
ncbi:unnamed protein product [Haemonchus placei]|uniref:CD36 family n=1 Tax=Haemonchus placei TaxID=6290 RepID=A0A0N4W5K0_HAEPC|nr:unnamed protein product [Haemonchus placei]